MSLYHVHNNDTSIRMYFSNAKPAFTPISHPHSVLLSVSVALYGVTEAYLLREDGAEVPQNQKGKIIFCCMQRKLMLLGEERKDLELLGRFSCLIYDKNQYRQRLQWAPGRRDCRKAQDILREEAHTFLSLSCANRTALIVNDVSERISGKKDGMRWREKVNILDFAGKVLQSSHV